MLITRYNSRYVIAVYRDNIIIPCVNNSTQLGIKLNFATYTFIFIYLYKYSSRNWNSKKKKKKKVRTSIDQVRQIEQLTKMKIRLEAARNQTMP